MDEEIKKEEKSEEPEKISAEQSKSENKVLKWFFIAIISFAVLFVITGFVINAMNHFTYNGVEFEIDKTQLVGKTVYKTSIPYSYTDKITGKAVSTDYNFWLRTDPRTLEDIRFEGEIALKDNMVINMTKDFNCNGDGIIAVANIVNVYGALGTKVIKDENAGCDDLYGRYIWVNIKEGNETRITEWGLNGGCYNIEVKDCEILEGTEKFLVETLAEANKRLK